MFNFGKKKKQQAQSKAEDQPAVVKKAGGSPKVKRKKRIFGGHNPYPVVAALKLQEAVPSSFLDKLKQEADEKDGAVRKVTGGYSVIVLDEATLEKVGLTPKNKDGSFGQLAASLRKITVITSATLAADMENGHVVIVPNKNSINSLDEFDELRSQTSFTWAIFPEDIEDDDLEAQVKLLKNTVVLPQLMQISESETDLSVQNDEMVVGDDVSNATAQPQADNNIADDDDEFEDMDGNEEFKTVDDDDDKSAPSNNQDSTPIQQSAPSSPQQQVTPQTDDDAADADNNADIFADDDDDSQPVVQSNPATPPTANDGQGDPSEPPASLTDDGQNQPQETEDDDEFWNSILDEESDEDDSSNDEPSDDNADDNESVPQPEIHNQIQGQGMQQEVQATPQQSVQQFQGTIGNIGIQKLYDQDLHLQVDTNIFNQMFDQAKPFEVGPISNQTNPSPLLNQMVNEARTDANTTLMNLNNRHRQQLVATYIQRVQKLIVNLNQKLEVDNAQTVVGKAKAAIEQTYQTAMGNQEEAKQLASKRLHDDYDTRREEVGKQASIQAMQAYDDVHLDQLHQREQQVDQQVVSRITEKRVTDLHDLNEKRQKAAAMTFKDVNSQIMSDMQRQFDNMRDDEAKFANDSEKRLKNMVAKFFRDDVRRTQAIADAKKHDDTVARVQAEDQQLRDQHRQELADVKQAGQQQLQELVDKYKDQHQQLINSYEAKIASQDKDMDKQKQAYAELENNMNQKLDAQLQSVKRETEERITHLNDRLSDKQNALDDANQTITNKDKALSDKDKMHATEMQQLRVATKRQPWITGLSVGFPTLVIGLLFGTFVLGSGGTKTITTQSTVPQSSNQTQTQVPYNITVNTPSQSQSSSSSESNNSSTSSNSSSHAESSTDKSHQRNTSDKSESSAKITPHMQEEKKK